MTALETWLPEFPPVPMSRGTRWGHNELPQGDHTDQTVLLVHHEEVVDGFGIGGQGPQVGDGLFGGHLLAESDQWGGHQAAGGLVGVGQERLHLVGLFHRGEGLDGLGGGDVAQQVGGLIGLHFVQDAGQGLRIQARGQFGRFAILQFLQNVRRVLYIQARQEGVLLLRRQFAEEVGLVGRAEGLYQPHGLFPVSGGEGRPYLAQQEVYVHWLAHARLHRSGDSHIILPYLEIGKSTFMTSLQKLTAETPRAQSSTSA